MTPSNAPAPLVPPEAAMSGWQLYELRKAEFLAAHPEATPDEIEAFCQRVAEEEGL